MSTHKRIPNRLKYFREKAGYTQEQVVDMLNYTPDDVYIGVPNNLAFYREKVGLSLQEVADKLGLASAGILASWEKAETYPDIQQAYNLSVIYHTTVENLYE